MVERVGMGKAGFSKIQEAKKAAGDFLGRQIKKVASDPKIDKLWKQGVKTQEELPSKMTIGGSRPVNVKVIKKELGVPKPGEPPEAKELRTILGSEELVEDRDALMSALREFEGTYAGFLDSETQDLLEAKKSSLIGDEIHDINNEKYDSQKPEEFRSRYQQLSEDIATLPQEKQALHHERLEQAFGDRTNRSVLRESFGKATADIRSTKKASKEEIDSYSQLQSLLKEHKSPSIQKLSEHLGNSIKEKAQKELQDIKNSHDTWNDKSKLMTAIEDIESKYGEETFNAASKKLLEQSKNRVENLLSWEIGDIESGVYDDVSDDVISQKRDQLAKEIAGAPISQERRTALNDEINNAMNMRTERREHKASFSKIAADIRSNENPTAKELEFYESAAAKLEGSQDPALNRMGGHIKNFIEAVRTGGDATDARLNLISDELNMVFSEPSVSFQHYSTNSKSEAQQFIEKETGFNENDFPEDAATKLSPQELTRAEQTLDQLKTVKNSPKYMALMKKATDEAVKTVSSQLEESEKNYNEMITAAKESLGDSSMTDEELLEICKEKHPLLASQLKIGNTASAVYMRKILNENLARDSSFLGSIKDREKIAVSTPAIHEQYAGHIETPIKNLETLIEHNQKLQ